MSHYQHDTAVVDEGAEIGEGTKIWHFCHVSSGAKIGRGCVLGQNVYVAPTVVLGDNVRVQNNVSLYDGVIVEEHAFLGPSCVFTNVKNPRSEVSRKHAYATTRVGRGASIGANATIVCGHDVGEYAFVGAGAVVTADVPPHALVLGVPARVAGWMCHCGERVHFGGEETGDSDGDRGECTACGRRYVVEGGALVEG